MTITATYDSRDCLKPPSVPTYTCASCPNIHHVATERGFPPPCPKCGGKKWKRR